MNVYVSISKKFLFPHRALQCTYCKIIAICLAWISASQIPEIAKHTDLSIYWEVLLHYWSWPQVIVRITLVKVQYVISTIVKFTENFQDILRDFHNMFLCWSHSWKYVSIPIFFKKSVFIHVLNAPLMQTWLWSDVSSVEAKACSALPYMHTPSFSMSNMQNFCLSLYTFRGT